MFRKSKFLLPLALPLALFVGCEGNTTSPDSVTVDDQALESCFATASGATKCALQSGGFNRGGQDVDNDGKPDAFVCAHLVKVPKGNGTTGGAGGHRGAGASADASPGAGGHAGPGEGHGPISVPQDADCDHLGCRDMRSHDQGAGDAGPTTAPLTAPSVNDMECPAAGAGPEHGAGGAPGTHGTGDGPDGHGPGGAPGADPSGNHGAGGAAAK